MADQASLISGARNMLRMNVKTLARVLRVSDRVISEIERKAPSDDPKVKDVVKQLENYGVYISDDGNENTSVSMDKRAGRLRFTFTGHDDAPDKMERFQRWLGVIGQMGWQPFLMDKSKGAGSKDSVDIFFTIASRGMASQRLEEWIANEGPLTRVEADDTQQVIESVEGLF